VRQKRALCNSLWALTLPTTVPDLIFDRRINLNGKVSLRWWRAALRSPQSRDLALRQSTARLGAAATCGGLAQRCVQGSMLKKEDLKEMASRCRLVARTADKFTRIRLLELAAKYEAQLESRSATARNAYSNRQPDRRNPD
jgi:hypothetical protein